MRIRMNIRLITAVAAALALPQFSIAQKANTLPNAKLAPGENQQIGRAHV